MRYKRRLELVKASRKNLRPGRRWRRDRFRRRPVRAGAIVQAPATVSLSPEEAAEATRFKALTDARAAQKFMVSCIMQELEGLEYDEISAVDDNLASAA